MPFGSKACLTRAISAITSGDSSRPRYARFRESDAVLAADRSFERDHAFEELAFGFRRAPHLVGIAGIDHQVDVDVAVAGMAEARDQQPVLATHALDELEELRHAAARHDQVVVDLARRERAQRDTTARGALPRWRRAPRSFAARRTSIAPARGRRRATRSASSSTPAGTPSTSRISIAPVPGGATLPAQVPLDRARATRRSISSIVAGTTRAASSADTARTAAAMSAKRRLQRRLHGRLRHEPQRDLGDDRQRAFRTDEQLGEVVADDVLDALRSGADDLAGRQARLRAPARSAWSCRTSPRADRRRTRRRCRRSTTASGSRDRADRTGRALRPPPAGRA